MRRHGRAPLTRGLRPGRVRLRPLRYRGLTVRQHIFYRRRVRPHVNRVLTVVVIVRSAPGVARRVRDRIRSDR